MTHNPYAPPAAVVADVPEFAPIECPWQVKWAAWMCALSMAASIPDFVREVVHDRQRELMGAAWWAMLGIFVAVCAGLAAWMIPSIYRGRRWARLVWCAFTVVGLLGIYLWFDEKLAISWYLAALNLLSTALDLGVVVLLFRPAANDYFNRVARSSR